MFVIQSVPPAIMALTSVPVWARIEAELATRSISIPGGEESKISKLTSFLSNPAE